MKQVVLMFPDIVSLCDFILDNSISHIDARSNPAILKGLLTDSQIMIAETMYNAFVEKMLPTEAY